MSHKPTYEELEHRVLELEQAESDFKRAEGALEDERRRLANFLWGTNVGTWEWNVQTGETLFNERWTEIIGYTLEELQPISIDTWLNFVHPDDLPISDEALQKHFRGETDIYSCEARMRHKDGNWVWVHDHGRVVSWTSDGKPLWMCGTHLDITVRKQTEAKLVESQAILEAAINQSPSGIVIADAPGVNIRMINPAAIDIRGGDSSQLTNIPLQEHMAKWQIYRLDGTSYPPEQLPLAMAVLHGELTRGEELIIRDHIGQEHIVITNAAPIRDSSGSIVAGIAVFHDITDRKLAEIERERLITELQEALANVRTLSGLLPICSSCRKVRDDEGYWNQIETYIRKHTEIDFSHGLCPECAEKLYGDQEWFKNRSDKGNK